MLVREKKGVVQWLTAVVLYLFVCVLCTSCNSDHGKTYRVARDPTWYPLDLQGQEKYVLGFSDDLLMNIAQFEHKHVELIQIQWDGLLFGLNQKRYDAILSSVLPIAEAADRYSFSEPYLMLGPVLVVPVQSTATQLQEMEGKIIGVENGSQAVILAAHYPTIIIRPYNNFAYALEDLSKEQIDGVLMPYLMAQAYCRDLYQGRLKVTGDAIGPAGLRLITLRNQDDSLLKWFDRGLEALKKDGVYNSLLQKWSLN